jgi:hypothetical protein
VLIGSHLSVRVPDRELRIAFGLILFLSGLKLVNVPEANYVIATGLGIGVVVLAAWLLRQIRIRRVAAQKPLQETA